MSTTVGKLDKILSLFNFSAGCCSIQKLAIGLTTTRRMSSTAPPHEDNVDMSGVHPSQLGFLEQDKCILVDRNDTIVGSASKKVCHQLANIRRGMLHRAFSLFLFNSAGELLVQRRASVKVTYPEHMTNTCCSHPLAGGREEGPNPEEGVCWAAQRKATHELGIPPKELPVEIMHPIARILYKADNLPQDGVWGEHELDYIVVAQCDVKTLAMNPTEVSETHYVSRDRFPAFTEECAKRGVPFTPWFRLMMDSGILDRIWTNLNNIEAIRDTTVQDFIKPF